MEWRHWQKEWKFTPFFFGENSFIACLGLISHERIKLNWFDLFFCVRQNYNWIQKINGIQRMQDKVINKIWYSVLMTNINTGIVSTIIWGRYWHRCRRRGGGGTMPPKVCRCKNSGKFRANSGQTRANSSVFFFLVTIVYICISWI